jgi:hypothetical protein
VIADTAPGRTWLGVADTATATAVAVMNRLTVAPVRIIALDMANSSCCSYFWMN